MTTVATWNVNSLRARLPTVLRYLDDFRPDVLCFQETRVADAVFPREPFADRGYAVAMTCTGGYAGVAVVAKGEIEVVTSGVADFPEERAPGRRLLCRAGGMWIDTVYVPTRTKIGKAEFLLALRADHDVRFADADSVILTGDFNICFDRRDYASPKLITDADVHPHRPEDDAFRRLVDGRFSDCFRRVHEDGGHFSWFPNATWARKRNYGMRLDYVFASGDLVARVADATHDAEPHTWPRPSDHVPVRVRFDA